MTTANTITNISYTGTTQTGNVTATYGIPVTAYIWGAGGGSTALYPGAGGGYSQVSFVANPGDILTVAVGQGGGAGGEDVAAPVTSTGLGGASYIALLFNTRYPPPGQDDPVTAYGNGDSFLDQWGVWNLDQNNITFTREYTINFPATANVIFQMSCNNTGTIALDGTTIINRPSLQNPNTPSQAFVKVTAGNHTITISGTGTLGALNRIGLIFGTGDQTSFSGGRGGISDPTSKQGFGGGGGGATILSLNNRVIGVGAGGGGGAGAAPTNINYITTRYIATLQFFDLGLQPGTNAYLESQISQNAGDVIFFVGVFWQIIINGTIVYSANQEPPATLARPIGPIRAYSVPQPSAQDRIVLLDFDYTTINSSAITNAMFNGQNGQDVFNFNTTNTGGGGGGGGGARGGNGGAGRGSGGGGFSGHSGLSLGGTAVFDPIGRFPFGNDYYPGGGVAEGAAAGTASNGGNGYVVLEFQTGGGILVKDGDEWKAVQTVYVKDDGTWKEVQTTYINQDGTWKPTQGGTVPTFSSIDGLFGVWTRPYSAGSLLAPPPPAPNYVADAGLQGPI